MSWSRSFKVQPLSAITPIVSRTGVQTPLQGLVPMTQGVDSIGARTLGSRDPDPVPGVVEVSLEVPRRVLRLRPSPGIGGADDQRGGPGLHGDLRIPELPGEVRPRAPEPSLGP